MGDIQKADGVVYKRSRLKNGDTILNGKYEVLKCIHSKGMANVYIVQDVNLCKQWCLKEIRKSQSGRKNIEYISLLQEANILRTLNNERIPRITEIADEGDSLFVVMDFLDGVTLKDFVTEKGRIPEDMAVRWMIQIVQTMGYLHSEKSNKKPIFYRDMKPENLMIRSNGVINIFDFGISIRVESKDQLPDYTLGTPGYAAPEQKKKNLPVDLRSDIYTMGLTFYFMLTGVDPKGFVGGRLKPISDWSPDVSPALIGVVEKCIKEDPNDRYQNCEELQYALENYNIFNEKHISSSRRKVNAVVSLFVVGALVSLSSVIPFVIGNSQSKEEYDKALVIAQQSGRIEDYNKVLSLDPLNLAPYEGYLDLLKEDGVFSYEEESSLLNYLNPNLAVLKKDPEYGRVAFEVGKLYWFYYEGSDANSGNTLSIKWFEDAIDADFNKDEASVYYNLGMFKKDISKSVKEASDSGMYKEYWNNLLKIQDVNTSDVVTIQTNLLIAECIGTYVYNLKKDGVTYSEISNELVILNDFVENYQIDDSTLDSIKNLHQELQDTLNGLEKRVSVVYSSNERG